MRLVYFAWVRESIGIAEETIEPAPGVATVADLLDQLAARGEGHAAAFADRTRLRFAVDLAMATLDTPVTGAGEVAIFPPVTGG